MVAIPSKWWLFLPSFHCMRPECPRPALVGGCCSPPTPIGCTHYAQSCAPTVVAISPLCLSFFFFAPPPCLVGGVVARPYPFFLAQGALGWWLSIPGGGYSPYPHYRRVVCLRHAPEDGGYSSLVFLLFSAFFFVGVEWWLFRCRGFFPVRRPGSEATPSFIRGRKGFLGSQWPPLHPHCLPLEYPCRRGANARTNTRPAHI